MDIQRKNKHKENIRNLVDLRNNFRSNIILGIRSAIRDSGSDVFKFRYPMYSDGYVYDTINISGEIDVKPHPEFGRTKCFFLERMETERLIEIYEAIVFV
jgi:hypothetical protein